MLFPESEKLYLPDGISDDILLAYSTVLYERTKMVVMDDLRSFIDEVDFLQLPTYVRNALERTYEPGEAEDLLKSIRENPIHREGISVNGLKVIAGYKKNAVISEFHTEEYYHGIERIVPADLTDDELVYEQVKLNSICEKAVIAEMRIDGLITDGVVKQKIDAIGIRLSQLKPNKKVNA